MSLRSALKSKFGRSPDKDSKRSVSTETLDKDHSTGKSWKALEEEEVRGEALLSQTYGGEHANHLSPDSATGGTFPASYGGERRGSQSSLDSRVSFKDEKSIYEIQLNQLQEQLVAAMIENQHLHHDLNDFKEKNKVQKIVADLNIEKKQNKKLLEQIRHLTKDNEKKRRDHLNTSPRRSRSRSPSSTCGVPSVSRSPSRSSKGAAEGEGWVDLAQEATEALLKDKETAEKAMATPRSLYQRAHEWLVHSFYDLVSDFTDDPEPEPGDGNGDGDPLTVKSIFDEAPIVAQKLKQNISRFKDGAMPVINIAKGVRSLQLWKYPSLTLIVFLGYMYAVWHGWLLPVILFLCITRLFLNYLKHRGWNINLKFLSEGDEHAGSGGDADENLRELGLTDRFNLVVQVSRQVQNYLGVLADNLEKLKNLMMWSDPHATMQLFMALCVFFIFSCLLSGAMLFRMIGLYLGVKFFIIDYIYARFPRFQQRHDSVYRLWKNLPTDEDLEKRYHREAIDKQVLSVPAVADDTRSLSLSRRGSDNKEAEDQEFCDIFAFPSSECPLAGWKEGRRCIIVNKDKTLTNAFRQGKLYLTRSFLTFERHRSPSPKNIVIPLKDITRIQKAKPYTWMPGHGMSIEITVLHFDKPLLFGAILGRDECYDNIVAHGLRAGLSWALVSSTPRLTLSSLSQEEHTLEGSVDERGSTTSLQDAHHLITT